MQAFAIAFGYITVKFANFFDNVSLKLIIDFHVYALDF